MSRRARLRVEVARAGQRANVNDLWIAATARATRLTVGAQDGDFNVVAGLGPIDLVQV